MNHQRNENGGGVSYQFPACVAGILVSAFGLMLMPGVAVITADSPTDGQLIIDHWETFKARFPANFLFWPGLVAMVGSMGAILTRFCRR